MDSQFLGSAVEMLILEVAGQGPTYGYELAQTVGERSDGYFELKEGSLYPALHRLERQKLLRSFWRQADGRRREWGVRGENPLVADEPARHRPSPHSPGTGSSWCCGAGSDRGVTA